MCALSTTTGERDPMRSGLPKQNSVWYQPVTVRIDFRDSKKECLNRVKSAASARESDGCRKMKRVTVE